MQAMIHIIGQGGIGSYLDEKLAKLQQSNQLIRVDGTSYQLAGYDDDEVELKNLDYQNFLEEDLNEQKAIVLGKRYNLMGQDFRVDQIKDIITCDDDIIICCVDSAGFRRSMFEEMQDLPNQWIDLRCHGRIVACYVKHEQNTYEFLLSTLPEEEGEDEGSCQRQEDLDAGIIQMGNQIAAPIGCQKLLNILRGVDQSPRFVHQF